ncbi:MAG: dTDP-4-dehydrorhamnose reductase [Gammaproteobacteria bacterium]|nr:dTDP-4-dehydrorhamnose reductase [Gammaproteobacteria bacterium]
MKILVTGANGQVGWELTRLGRVSDHEIVACARDRLDITQKEAVEALIEKEQPQLVINAAAYTAVDRAEEEREIAWAINCNGPQFLAAACQQFALPLFHISTDYVFDGTGDAPYSERDPVAPLGVYGESKWAGEEVVRSEADRHLILRTSWVFGSHGHNFVKTILRVAAERSELRVVADQLGSPTSARGIARTLLALAERYREQGDLAWGTYHFTGAPFTSWHGFATEIVERAIATGLLAQPVTVTPITTAEYPTPAERPANSRLSSARLQQQFGLDADDWQQELDLVLSTLLSPQ